MNGRMTNSNEFRFEERYNWIYGESKTEETLCTVCSFPVFYLVLWLIIILFYFTTDFISLREEIIFLSGRNRF